MRMNGLTGMGVLRAGAFEWHQGVEGVEGNEACEIHEGVRGTMACANHPVGMGEY